MTGTNCDLFTHKSSRSYLNHLVYYTRACEWGVWKRYTYHVVKQTTFVEPDTTELYHNLACTCMLRVSACAYAILRHVSTRNMCKGVTIKSRDSLLHV